MYLSEVQTAQPNRVSIHAPAGGATQGIHCLGVQPVVSIHAPAGGATRQHGVSGRIRQVSIHAPAGGATCQGRSPLSRSIAYVFQSTPPQGGRRRASNPIIDHFTFQSTPPQGGRLDIRPYMPNPLWFQSTPPQGGRLVTLDIVSRDCPFQSTPPQGGRRGSPSGVHTQQSVSIHAPAGGATSHHGPCCSLPKFQSTPPQGGRRAIGTRFSPRLRFNPRPRRGGDESPRALL